MTDRDESSFLDQWLSELADPHRRRASPVPREPSDPGSSQQGSVNWNLGDLQAKVGRLFVRNDELERELVRLRAVVRVLVEMLIVAGAVEQDELSTRLSEALDAVEAARAAAAEVPPRAPSTPPIQRTAPSDRTHYRDDGIQRVIPPPRTVCTRCETEVLLAATVMTEDGVICEECFRLAEISAR